MDKYEKAMLEKIDNEDLVESDVREIIHEYGIETKYGDNRRWSRWATTISEIGDRYFRTGWDKGLTESQENEYPEYPVEVQQKTYEKTITVTEWMPVKNESEDK